MNDTVLRAPAPSQTLGTLKSEQVRIAPGKGGRPQRGKVQFNNKVKKGFAGQTRLPFAATLFGDGPQARSCRNLSE